LIAKAKKFRYHKLQKPNSNQMLLSKKKKRPSNFTLLMAISVLFIFGILAFSIFKSSEDERFVTYTVNPKKQDLKFYWKNEKDENFGSIQNLKNWLESKNKKLTFAINGGMYQKDGSPQGLYIENYKTLTDLDTNNAGGNFYLKPNGVFFISNNDTPEICTTENFKPSKSIKYATQSGPMLVINGKIHAEFKEKSSNLNIRNGVGILPNHSIVFAMSKEPINFYDFATYFKSLGCKDALYLDGLVSRTYLPEKKWIQTDGNFGVIIGVIK
jgi:uncharacterized protein YigE (DUF2233 family)